MIKPRLDLNLLVTLKVLLTQRSVSRAAEIMCVTQPAMSGSLARLREYFGDHLIVQVGRRMELTPLAESLLGPLGETLTRIHATLATQPHFDPATSQRQFSILASDYVVSVLLQPVLARIEQQAPAVRVLLRPPADGAAALLDAGEVDLLVVPTRFASSEQAAVPLFEDDYRVIADAGHSELPDPLPFDTYLGMGHVVFNHFGKPDYDSWFEKRHGDLRRIDLVVNSFWQMAQVMAGSRRIAVMPSRMARLAAAGLPLRLLVPGFETPKFGVVMQWHRFRESDPGSCWLRSVILEQAQRLR